MEAVIGTVIFLFLLYVFLRIDTNVIQIKKGIERLEAQQKKEKK